MEKQSSWSCTLITLLSLCFALYCAINMGQPQQKNFSLHRIDPSRPHEFYFISVRGGFRPLKDENHLLKQMEKVVNLYKVGFVINISELGQDDPLLQNATQYSHSLKVPWYTTGALKGQESDYFVKRIKISHGKTLDVIVLDTSSLQDFSSGSGTIQLQWLTRTLGASSSNWHIVVGVHPLLGCGQNTNRMEPKQDSDSLYQTLLKYGANAYLSGQSCSDNATGTSPISNPDFMVGGPSFTAISRELFHHKEIESRFLLHRVTSLEIVTYAVTFEGNIVHKYSVPQSGREVL